MARLSCRDVTPGAYTLTAQCFDGGTIEAGRQPVLTWVTTTSTAHQLVTGRRPGVEGIVRMDGDGGTALGNLQVSLASQEMMFRMGMQDAKVGDDGTFSLSNVPADIYAVKVSGMAETFYISSQSGWGMPTRWRRVWI